MVIQSLYPVNKSSNQADMPQRFDNSSSFFHKYCSLTSKTGASLLALHYIYILGTGIFLTVTEGEFLK